MFSQNRRKIVFGIVLCLFLSSISVSRNLAGYSIVQIDISQPSSVEWSDDFENETETLNQWLFTGYNRSHGVYATPNVTVSNGMLYSTGPTYNYMFHNSTTTVGTWSLDVFLGYDFNYLLISFMSVYQLDPEIIGGPDGYLVYLSPDASIIHFTLAYWVPDFGGNYPEEIDTYSFSRTSGWVHIDITRQADTNLNAYLNGTLRLQGMDTRASTSEHFAIEAIADSYFIFDNITVSDTVDIDKESPHWTEPLVDQLIIEGDDFHYSLHAYDSAGLDTWWVADSTHFSIDQEGNLTSIEPLPLGTYGIEVYVNDTFGNVLNGTFNLEIIELPPATTPSTPTATISSTTTTNGTPLQLISVLIVVVSIGSLGVIVVVIVLIVRKKQGP
ncbi:MAG: hypothetical protein ACTSWA_07930 [Candidatus Thorarchaeota archaeon]